MKKQPIYYNNNIVGYVDDIIYCNDIIEMMKIYLFYSEHYTDIIENIKKSTYSTLNTKNSKYSIELDEDYLICKLIN